MVFCRRLFSSQTWKEFKYWPFKCTWRPTHFLWCNIKCARLVFYFSIEWSEHINDNRKLKQESCAMTRLSMHKSLWLKLNNKFFKNLHCLFFFNKTRPTRPFVRYKMIFAMCFKLSMLKIFAAYEYFHSPWNKFKLGLSVWTSVDEIVKHRTI